MTPMCDKVIYAKCNENRGQSDYQCQGNSAAEVTFEQGLKKPVVIGEERGGRRYFKQLM